MSSSLIGAPLDACASKVLGAYYTDANVADFLAWWAIRSPHDTVMDPCFGGGVFLQSACRRLALLGAQSNTQVFGVEIDADVHRRISAHLESACAIERQNLRKADFFSLEPKPSLSVDTIIGNPPFIRYQRFTGEFRKIALARSAASGVLLPELCSSWAPFLVHAIAMLRTGGRLAMVLPMEIAHAKYARPVMEHIHSSFKEATFLTFRTKLFPNLSEDTLLLLAEGKGSGEAAFFLKDSAHLNVLSDIAGAAHPRIPSATRLNAKLIVAGTSRLIEYQLPPRARSLYNALKIAKAVERVGNLADIGIGYVTGANDFFHLSPADVRRHNIPREFLKPAVRRGRSLIGLRFTHEDWESAILTGEAGYFLHIVKGARLPEPLKRYIALGESSGISSAYKCRVRTPWFCVPHVHKPDAFVSYMSGVTPRLVANEAGVYAPNSLHIAKVRPLVEMSADVLAALWMTSLTRLSAEIEGHALGGGMLKIEPTEARNVLVPFVVDKHAKPLRSLANELDELVREGCHDRAQTRADEAILEGILGISKRDCQVLRSAADTLRSRRGYPESSNATA